jgi:glyoxylase-like metal-dependent hydrolase (beta-lactamase superfamily II)
MLQIDKTRVGSRLHDPRMRSLVLALPILLGATFAGGDRGASLLALVSAEMGVPALEEAGFIQLTFAGTYDESVERGGFEPEPPAPVRDTFAVDVRGGEAGWDSEGRRGDGSVRWRRFFYPEPDLLVRVEVPTGFAAATRSPAYGAERLRVARAVPQALLRELQARPEAVRALPPVERSGERFRRLAYAAAPGDEIEILIDARYRVRFVETVRGVPFVGERRISWEYGLWTRQRGVLVPRRLTIWMGGEALRALALHAVVWNRAEGVLAIPEGIAPPEERAGPASLPPAPLAPSAREIAEGVWIAPDVRPGIHGYFILRDDGVTAFEAPAGFLYPQIEIPPPDLARGRAASEPSEAFVDLIRRTLPGRPMRRVVVSHAHADHAGGVRAFAAAGAEIVVPRGAAGPVRRFLDEPFARRPDRWEHLRRRARPVVREVSGRVTVGTGIEVLEVGDNPHSAAMAVLWLPGPRLVLQGDLFYADLLPRFPSPSRVAVMKWFAGWLASEGLEPSAIWGTHEDAPGTREHLDKLAATPD